MIALAESARAEMEAHGREAYPEECCGALLGTIERETSRVTRVERLPNSQMENRARRFSIAPQEYRRVEKIADSEGLRLVGFYHSHPDHPALPSEHDREQALPFFHYIVLAVSSGRPGDLTSWVLSEDRGAFTREEIITHGPGE